MARKAYSEKLATAEKNRIVGVASPALAGLAQIAKDAATSTAAWQADVDAVFATFERG